MQGSGMKRRIKIGYARVSTEDQNLDLQIHALRKAGCKTIYTDDGISGTALVRPGLQQAIASIKPGSKLVVWRLDRLGRSVLHLAALLEQLDAEQVKFQSLCESIDTDSSGGRLVFHMMGALAEFERLLISERTKAGLAAARRRGSRLGRPRSLAPEQIEAARSLLLTSDWPLHHIAEAFRVHESTLRRAIYGSGPFAQRE